MKKIFLIIIIIIQSTCAFSSEFDELDKPPEGAHKGQMLLGVFSSIGLAFGDIIDAETNFLEDNTYTFTESETTKKIMVTHLGLSFGATFEYMPIDHIGIKTKIRKSYIIQRTLFGTDFKNWNGYLFKDIAIYLGPSFHLTARKQWDINLTPFIGYSFAEFEATPIGSQLISGYSGDTKRTFNTLVYGAEINFTAYFSGGLYLSFGFDWNMNQLKFGTPYSLTQSSGVTYEGTDSDMNSICFIISAGYAFSN